MAGEEKVDRLESMDKTLRELLKWTRFANIGKLKEMLEATLDSAEKKIAFESTDGVRTSKEVAATCDTPEDTVYGWWQKWFRLGLVVESESRKGRMTKIVSLDDVGIKVPKKTAKLAPAAAIAQPAQDPQPPGGNA